MTPDDLARIEARAAAATDGPWSVLMADEYGPWCWWMTYPEPDDPRFDWKQTQTDAEFVDAARTDVPALIAYARELEAERDTLLDNLDDERVILGDALRERDAARAALARVTAACAVYRKIAEASPYFGDDLTDEDWAAITGPTPTEGDTRA